MTQLGLNIFWYFKIFDLFLGIFELLKTEK